MFASVVRTVSRAACRSHAGRSRCAFRHISLSSHAHQPRSDMKRLGAVFGGSMVVGTIVALGAEAVSDAITLHPATRKAELEALTSAGNIRKISLTYGGDDITVYIQEDVPSRVDDKSPVVLIAADSLTLLRDLSAELADAGKRCISYEIDFTEGKMRKNDQELHSAVITAVVNACRVEQPLIVVSTGIEWLSALHFVHRNVNDISGFLLVDPILPKLPTLKTHSVVDTSSEYADTMVSGLRIQVPRAGDVHSAGSPTALLSPSITSHDSNTTSTPREIPEEVRALLHELSKDASPISGGAGVGYTLPVAVRSWDPLHALEHFITGDTHHHLLCGEDHKQTVNARATASTNSVGADQLSPALGSEETPAHVRWRHATSSGAKTATNTQTNTQNISDVADTVDATTLQLERVYRDRLSSVSRRPCVADMLPSFAQSLAPSYARGVTLSLPGSNITIQLGKDDRIAHMDSMVSSFVKGTGEMHSFAEWLSTLREVGSRVPMHVRITTPSYTKIAPQDSDSAHYLLEQRKNCRSGAFAYPTEMEVNVRAMLQVDAEKRLHSWRKIAPGRCSVLPPAPAVSGHDIFDPDVRALVGTVQSMAAMK